MSEQPAAAGGQLQAHVWVRRPHVPIPWPGLILDRRRGRDGGWEALVTYIYRPTVQEQVVTEWVPYSWLIPGAAPPSSGTAYG